MPNSERTRTLIREILRAGCDVKVAVARHSTDEIAEAAGIIGEAMLKGGKVLLFGNGGSAADAQHIAGEIVGRFRLERRGLPAIALTTDTSVLTAIGNDYGFDAVFARQIEALGVAGDVAVAISTSGNAANVVAGARRAREMGISVIGLTGGDGGALKPLCSPAIVVPCAVTPRIQEAHIAIGHIICELVEDRVLGTRAQGHV